MSDQVRLVVGVASNGDQADVMPALDHHASRRERLGLVTLTAPLLRLQGKFSPAVNPTNGIAQNVNAAFTGTPVVVHDGTDSVAWTATDIVGTKMTADSTDRPNNGTKSVKVANPSLGDVWEFDKGSTIDLSAYIALTLAVNIDSNWGSEDSIEVYGWDGSAELGNRVKLENYFDQFTFDVWAGVAIPLVDMGLEAETTLTGLRMQNVAKGGGPSPTFYIDDFQVEETGGSALYKAVTPKKGSHFWAKSLRVTMSDALAGTLADGTMPALSVDKFLGVSALPNGIVMTQVEGNEVVFSLVARNIEDLFARGFVMATTPISDGVNTLIVMEIVFPEMLRIGPNPDTDYIGFLVQDDLSGLRSMSTVVFGGMEI